MVRLRPDPDESASRSRDVPVRSAPHRSARASGSRSRGIRVARSGTLPRRVPEIPPRLAPMIDRSDGTPEIRLVDLAKHFREVRAVDGVSLEIRAGEFFSLLGPSGCGKTTTLRMIGGFELPTGGRIELRGRDVTNDPPDKRPVNMVFQNYALFPHLDVGDNVAFGLKPQGRRQGRDDAPGRRGARARPPRRLREAQAEPAVRRPAAARRARPCARQPAERAAPRRAARRPRPQAPQAQLQVELKRIQAEVGITFVYVTHDQEEALTMSDRIAVMHARQGRAARARPRSSTSGPTTRFVADFIGTTNLLRGSSKAARTESRSSASSPAIGCRVGARSVAPPASAIELSVRPESISDRGAGRRRHGRSTGCRPRSSRSRISEPPSSITFARPAGSGDRRARAEDRPRGSPVGDDVESRGRRPRLSSSASDPRRREEKLA